MAIGGGSIAAPDRFGELAEVYAVPLALLVIGLVLWALHKRTHPYFDAFVASVAAMGGFNLFHLFWSPFELGSSVNLMSAGCLGFWSLAVLLTGVILCGPMLGIELSSRLWLFGVRAVIGYFVAIAAFFVVCSISFAGVRCAAAWLPLGALSTLIFLMVRHCCWHWLQRRAVRVAIFFLPVALAAIPGVAGRLAWLDSFGGTSDEGPLSPLLWATVAFCLSGALFLALSPNPPRIIARHDDECGASAGEAGAAIRGAKAGGTASEGNGIGVSCGAERRPLKARIREFFARYFGSPWPSAAVYVVFLFAFVAVSLSHNPLLSVLSNVLSLFLGIAFLGILAAGLWSLVRQRWKQGLMHLVMLLGCGVLTCLVVPILMLAAMTGPSEDGFAENLSIPTGIEVAEPREPARSGQGQSEDVFQKHVLAALAGPGGDDPTVTAHLPVLLSVQEKSPEILKRFLAASPAWRVFEEHGQVFATRRWMIGTEWRYTLHGYYTDGALETWPHTGIPPFQSRVTIGLSGRPWARYGGDATQVVLDTPKPLKISIGNDMFQSRCIIAAGKMPVEVFEQSQAKERRLTKAALAHLDAELAPLAAEPTWATVRTILPPHSIRKGDKSFELIRSFQPGIYESSIWINPGESGMICLKAFEITKGTALSGGRLKESSNEWIGWSDDPCELFFSNTNFTIYEGDWGKPYAARFEVWFTSDSGAPDRKLMEKVFKIEGWQR